MRGKKRIPNSITLISAIGMSIALFQFWHFIASFLIIGATATFAIGVMTGYMVDFIFVLIIEYLLMVIIISVAFFIQSRRLNK